MPSPSSFTPVLQPEKLSAKFVSCLAYRDPPARYFYADNKVHFSRIFKKIQPAADTGNRTGIVFKTGDFSTGQEMYTFLKDRLRYNPPRSETAKMSLAEQFEHQRQFRKAKADFRHSLLLEVGPDHVIPNAPAVLSPSALLDAVGKQTSSYLISFRDLQEIASAQEITDRGGFPIKELDNNMVRASLGVFWPRPDVTRLVGYAPLTEAQKDFAYDVGTGSGVLSLILAKRGVRRITATDVEMRALQCAQTNVDVFQYGDKIQVVKADLFPKSGGIPLDNAAKPSLIVCNPPWLPGNPSSSVERAVFDRDLKMLSGFLDKLASKLRKPDGVAWLVYSNLVEILGFRTRRQLLDLFDSAQLQVVDQMETKTLHKRSMTTKPNNDLFSGLRQDELISLWVLKPKDSAIATAQVGSVQHQQQWAPHSRVLAPKHARQSKTRCFFMGIVLLMLFVAAAWLLSRMMWMQRLRPLRQPHRYHVHIAATDDVITAGSSNIEEEEEDNIVRPTKLVWKSGVGWTRVPITDDVVEEEEPTVAAAGDNSPVIIRVEGQKSIIKRDLPLIQRGYEAAFPNRIVFANDSSTADLVLCLSLSTCFGANDADDDLPQLNRGNVIVNRIAHLRTVLWSKKSFCETVPSFVAELVSFPCWVLPDAGLDLRDLDNNEQTTKWIAKPYSSGGGRGIYVVDNAHDMREILRSDKKLVIQPFLPNPMLVNKRKVDLRVYVLVTSIVPLRAYVHSRGLVRFASQEYYTITPQQQSKSQFLTNTSINKKTSNMTAAELTWSFASLWENVGEQRARIMRMKIDRSVALILLSVESRFAQLMSSTSLIKRYHLLGVDVIFSSVETDEAKVIEVNGEPSFVASDAKEQTDYAHYDESKVKVQRDVASIVLATSPPWLSTESNNKHFAATYYNELDRESQADTEFRLIYPTAVVGKHANVLDQIWALQGHNRRELHEYLTERELALFNKHCEGDDDTVRRRKCTKPRSGQREMVFNDLSMYDDDI